MDNQTKAKIINAQQLDPNMRLEQRQHEDMKWRSPHEEPFHIAGFPWFKREKVYRRLPEHPAWPIREPLDQLANCTSGGQVRFRTNASKLAVRVVLTNKANMNHMAVTGQCGFDCYIGEPGHQKFVNTTRYDHTLSEYEAVLFDWQEQAQEREMRMITLNFPLYMGVQELLIGLSADAVVEAPAAYGDDRTIIVYGTSITQGACASRPGMSYTNLLSRRFNCQFYNQGYSGNGRGEPEMSRILRDIPNPALLILDYEANVESAENLRTTLPEFIRIYRERHPEVPILVLSKTRYSRERFSDRMFQMYEERRRITAETVERTRSQGDRHIRFLDGTELLGDNYEECTVDGAHPTDLGFQRIADGLAPVIAQLLQHA